MILAVSVAPHHTEPPLPILEVSAVRLWKRRWLGSFSCAVQMRKVNGGAVLGHLPLLNHLSIWSVAGALRSLVSSSVSGDGRCAHLPETQRQDSNEIMCAKHLAHSLVHPKYAVNNDPYYSCYYTELKFI